MAEDWARPVVHWEIQARDPQRLREFYGQLFNWQIGDGPLMRIAPGIGGPEPGPGGHIRQSQNPGVSLFIQVRDLRTSLDKAAQLGGTVHLQPTDTPGGPTIAGIADPEGNRVMLVQQ
jgi:predicted enzyme related to lactoylglutathione lyase